MDPYFPRDPARDLRTECSCEAERSVFVKRVTSLCAGALHPAAASIVNTEGSPVTWHSCMFCSSTTRGYKEATLALLVPDPTFLVRKVVLLTSESPAVMGIHVVYDLAMRLHDGAVGR